MQPDPAPLISGSGPSVRQDPEKGFFGGYRSDASFLDHCSDKKITIRQCLGALQHSITKLKTYVLYQNPL